MTDRHRAERDALRTFAEDEVLVVCPACGGRALVRLVPLEEPARDGPFRAEREGRLTCAACGHNARRAAFVQRVNAPVDPVFGCPVWLQGACVGETLWAYNARHLAAIEAFVRAPLRERRRDDEHGWRNAAWTSRAPRWLTAAGNRDAVLQAIARLRRERLGDAG